MSESDRSTRPLSFRAWLRTPVGGVVLFVSVLAFLYSLLIEGVVLLGVLVVVTLLAVPWALLVVGRLVRALERLADTQERLVTLRERRVNADREVTAAIERD